jgi:hypothetical protein
MIICAMCRNGRKILDLPEERRRNVAYTHIFELIVMAQQITREVGFDIRLSRIVMKAGIGLLHI